MASDQTSLVATDPQAIIMKALEVNPTPEVLEKMMQLEREWRAMVAERAFVAAKARFKSECPSVLAKTASASFDTKKGGAVRYRWTPLEDIVETVTPHLARNGLDIHWSEEQSEKGMVKCTFHLSHELGHSETNSLAAPRGENSLLSGAQNLAATVTSLRRYTMLGGLGLATVDDEEGSSKANARTPRPTKVQIAELERLSQDPTLLPELRSRAEQVLVWAQRGQRINVQPVIDELSSSVAPEPPERDPGSEG